MAAAAGQLQRLHTALRANGHADPPDSVEASLDILLGMGRKRKRSVEPSVAQTIRDSISQRIEARLAAIDKRTLVQLCRELDKDLVQTTPSEASVAAAHEATEKLLK
jgi:hypothetical protein